MTKEPSIQPVQDLGGVYLLDTVHAGYQGTVGVFLLPGPGGSFALVETGPQATADAVIEGVVAAGFEPAGLSHILLTHIHLDHAGAAGLLATRYGAQVYVHSRGLPHLADPSRLLASAERIYGEDMERLWGGMTPIPTAQLHALEGGERLEFSGHRVEVVYTPGHASHHLSFLLQDGTLFCGDAAAIKHAGSAVVRPALPPPDLDLELWDRSLARMLDLNPDRLLLTHFGEVAEAEAHLRLVSERNRFWAEEILRGMRQGESSEALSERIERLGTAELESDGAPEKVKARHAVTSSYDMTVMGVSRYWQKHHPERLA